VNFIRDLIAKEILHLPADKFERGEPADTFVIGLPKTGIVVRISRTISHDIRRRHHKSRERPTGGMDVERGKSHERG
jgi:hypothetical protein